MKNVSIGTASFRMNKIKYSVCANTTTGNAVYVFEKHNVISILQKYIMRVAVTFVIRVIALGVAKCCSKIFECVYLVGILYYTSKIIFLA